MKAKELSHLSTKMGGSTLTKIARSQSLRHLSETLKAAGRVSALDVLKAKDIRIYIDSQAAAGVGLRTLQNRMTHVRTALRAIGRGQLADSPQLENKTLGIHGASRNGTHRALTPEQYTQVLAKADQVDVHSGFKACLMLQRELGLRAREAVQSGESLKGWLRALERGDRVQVTHGTKGGRARDTGPVDQQRAIEAVKAAIAAFKTNGNRMVASTSLQGAMRAYGRFCEGMGLTGEHASHSLRCMYAQDRYTAHLAYTGGNRREALAMTSLDLGHGDGRGTYVAQVYLAR
jgi:Integrase/Phage integrase, N-terminal